MNQVRIIQDTDRAIEVMYNAGTWMENSGLNPSQWWKPENMNREFLLQHTEANEYYAALLDNQPAASVILQETERNQSWKSVDGDNPKHALYVHWLCVHRSFAGRGLSKKMIEFAEEVARKRRFKLLRLDTDADEIKLCKLYERLGFKLTGTKNEDGHNTAFFEKKIV